MHYTIVKFTLIVICLIIAVLTRKEALNRRDWAFLVMALIFTLGADFFLLVVPNYVVGVTIFWGAHIFLALRFGGGRIWPFFFLALPLSIASLFFVGDALVATALVYASLFVISYTTMILALKKKKFPQPNSILIAAGMSLFVICDIFVALFNLGGMGLVSHAISEFAVDAIWLFYAPAQLCLALSAKSFVKTSDKLASSGGLESIK